MSTVSSSTFEVNGGAVTGTFSYNPVSRQVTFTPDSEFLHNTVYSVNITQGVFSIDGKPLESAYSWSFTTEIYYFNVVSVYPASGATGVPVISDIVVQFDDNIDDTPLASSILVNGSVPGLVLPVGYDPLTRTATFNLSSDLSGLVLYTITLTTGIKNLKGESMASDYSWSFTTASLLSPEIYALSPLGVDMLSGTIYDFGNALCSTTKSSTFTIGNSGTDILSISNVTLSDTTNFATSLTNGSIAAGGSQTFTVTFQPDTVAGTKNCSLTVTSNDSDESSFIINLTGLALTTAAPEIEITDTGIILISPDSTVDFGTLTIGDTGTKTIVIHNIGTANLNISGTTIGGTNPTLFNTGFTTATIVPGATANVVINFSAPVKINARATITFTNNDSDEGTFVVKLKGRTMP
jgi:hypothetical protein